MRRFTRMLTAVVAVLVVSVAGHPTAAQAADVPIPYHAECDLHFSPGIAQVTHAPINGVDAWQISFDTSYPYPPSPGGSPMAIDFNPGDYCQIGNAMLVQQLDGNLVLYDEFTHARWATSWLRPNIFHTGNFTRFQSDANFVQYSSTGAAVWASDTYIGSCAPLCWAHSLAVQADGNVVIYGAGRPLWSTKTYHNFGA